MLLTTYHLIFLKNNGGGFFTAFLIFSQETQYLKNVFKVVFYPFISYQIEDQVLRTRVMALHIHMIVYFPFSAGNCKEKRCYKELWWTYIPVLSFTVNSDRSESTSKPFREKKFSCNSIGLICKMKLILANFRFLRWAAWAEPQRCSFPFTDCNRILYDWLRCQ